MSQESGIIERTFPTIVAVWRGDIALSRMLWLYMFVGFVGLAIPINFVRVLGFQPSGIPWVLYSVGLVCYACFVCVGTWKSADKLQGSLFVKFMVKLTILLIYINMSAGFLSGVISATQ